MNVITSLEISTPRSPFILQLPRLSAAENQLWTQRLRDVADDCGCSMGAKFVAGYAVLLPFFAWSAVAVRHWSGIATIAASFVALIAVAGAGKAAGRALARARLRRAVDDLRREL